MQVEVRHSLANPIIDGQKCAFRFKCDFYGLGQQLALGEHRTDEFRRKVQKRNVMHARTQQYVPGEKRVNV